MEEEFFLRRTRRYLESARIIVLVVARSFGLRERVDLRVRLGES
jgi:hypothetical protein